MGAESGMNSSVRDDRVALSDGAKALWGKTNRIDDSEWLPLYVHMVDSAAMASKIWDTWVPQGTKAVIVGDLGNDEVLARKLMIFMAGIHDIGKATPVFQAKSITFGPEAGSFAWKAERAGLPMIAGLRGTNHPTHPIAGEIILEGYLLRVRGWERKAARQYACVVGGHHGTPPDKSKIDEEKNRKTNVGLDSEAWVSTQDELIDFVANISEEAARKTSDAKISERRRSTLGTPPPEIQDLVRVEDRLSFAYFEHCTIGRDDNAITVTDVTGVIHVPAAALSVLMLGPGARVTHQAMTVIGENGATVIWVGERGVRMYAFGKPLTHSSALLQKQAELVSNTRKRLSVARMMYQMRFPGEDVSGLTMQQLRGREGARIRRVYRECSERTGVEWDKRTYDHDDFDAGSEINKALSAANTCLYGLAHAAIVALGCSPGLGFVHVGHERSFVYDIADLYKAELSIPVAFETVAAKPEDIGSAVRHNIRDAIYDLSLMKRMTKDIRYLLGTSELEDDVFESDHVGLWDDKQGEVSAGKSYSDNDEWDGGTW